jgi:ABC-type lipoprotein release transport system permease subunit
MKTWTIAARQVRRSRRRTFVTVAAMGFAGIAMIFYASLTEGFFSSMEQLALVTDTGDLQIHAEGYLDDPNLYARIEAPDAIIAALEEKGLAAAPRLFGFGLAAAGTSSSGAVLRGVDLERQPKVTLLHQAVQRGHWLDAKKPNDVVVGKKLARTLGVSLGGEIVFLSQDTQGFTANEIFKVRGILGTVSEVVDRAGIFIPEASFRTLMSVEDGCHEIVVMRGDVNDDLERIRAEVVAAAPGRDVKTWKKLLPTLAKMLENSDAGMIIMIFITYAAVAMVILNAMLMGVFERIREFGVMKAIGVPPWQVAAMIGFEALILSALASAIALAGGLPLSFYVQSVGIDLSAFLDGVTFGGVAVDPIWRPHVTVKTVFQPLAYLFFITILAVVYPAFKAAVIRPVEAIRHN